LIFAGRGLWQRRRWARAPLLVSQALLLAVGVPLVQGAGARWVGILLVAAAAVALCCLLTPVVTAELRR
jgi:hypothetical protein